MTITRLSSTWYEVTGTVRDYIVKKINGGWIVVGALPGERFGETYGGAQDFHTALETAIQLAEAEVI